MDESLVVQMCQNADLKRLREKRQLLEAEREARKHRPGRPRKVRQRKTFRDRRKKHEFYETRVGYFLALEAPLEYKLIVEASGNCEPHPDLIEQIGYSSLNPLFKKPKFRRALIEYRQLGCYAYRANHITPKIAQKYIQKRKMMGVL